MILDSDPEEFRRAAHRTVDWIADYLKGVEEFPVAARVKPGEISALFAEKVTGQGKSLDVLLDEFQARVLPGVTHWNHPSFFAYFAITGSQAGIIGEMLSAALNINGMLWKTSPAATELETVVLSWLLESLGLPSGWFGIINDTASINSFLALAAAREALGLDIRTEGMSGRALPQLRVYCSDQAHSSIEKAALALGFGVRGLSRIPADDAFRMDTGRLREQVRRDREEGVRPCAVVATVGTTSTAAVDPVREISEIAAANGMWLHVDAAYAGSATIDPEFRFLWDGVERADSLVVNPHKWLFTPVDCSVLFTSRPEVLKQTFSLVPEYLKTSQGDEVINYMDYGLQLGRRFRALKLWLVLQHYGLERLRAVIRDHVRFAERLTEALQSRQGIELLAPQSLSVVVFRRVEKNAAGQIDEQTSEKLTMELLETMNASGVLFVSHTRLRDRYGIRVAIGNGATEWRHVERILSFLE